MKGERVKRKKRVHPVLAVSIVGALALVPVALVDVARRVPSGQALCDARLAGMSAPNYVAMLCLIVVAGFGLLKVEELGRKR